MSFFYDLNKKLDSIRATPEVTHQQLNERDEGKPGKNFAKIAKDAGERYGSKASGERVAGAVRNKLNAQGKLEEEGMSRAAKGYEKYGKEGMEALAKAGREGKALDPVRKKYDKYNNNDKVNEMYGPYDDDKVDAINAANPPKASGTGMKPATPVKHHTYDRKAVASNISGKDSAAYDYRGQVEEGPMDTVKKIGKKVASGINKLVGHGSDEDMIKDLKRKSGAPVTGKKPEQKTTEAAKYRDPKYKDKLYTQEPPDYTYGPDMDDAYDNPKPDDYAGRKRKIGGGEFPSIDPLASGLGIGRSGIKNNILDRGPRKGMPSRNQITSLKGSIKAAKGTHAEPNLPEAGAPMTAKQKSFAKLAPPTDKITFADKIAGAKKEVDEMLGQVAAEAMRNAIGGGQGRNAAMDEDNAFDYKSPRKDAPKVGSIERGHKHDIKHTATGRMVTRRTDDQGNSVGADDDSDTQAGPRGRGRPKGTKGAIGAKGPSGRSKLMTKEGVDQQQAQQIYDELADIRSVAKQAAGGRNPFPQGFASRLESSLWAAMTLLKNQQSGDAQVREEEKTSTRDDRAEKAGKKVTKDIEYDEKEKDNIHGKEREPEDDKAEKAGKKVAKDIEHDEKKKEKEVDESNTSGSVATSTATKSSKGSMIGKGIYDSMNRELENMIAESMSINMSDSTEGNKSLTITATDEDALKLGMLLKNAGLGGGDQHSGDMHSHGEEACDTCGMPDCGCGDVQEAVDENSPDWPTNTETSPDALQYAGGLNKPKTDVAGDGQTTIPNSAVHTQDEDALRRMMEMAGIKQADLEPWKETMKEDAEEDATDAENAVNDAEAAEEEIQESFAESIQRMREIAGIKEAKKDVEEEKTEEGNLFTGNLAKARADGKKQADLDGDGDMEKVRESIFALDNQWRAYKG
jgi:hypothetical protein